MQFLFDLDNIW